MSLTDSVLVLLSVCLLGWLLFDQVITGWLKGPTLLKVSLLRSKRIDGAIFIGLLAILLYNNINSAGEPLTGWLLSVLLVAGVYLVWLRRPALLLKPQGFWLCSLFIPYRAIHNIRLSEDGVLVIRLASRNLLIRVRNIDDLEHIYRTMIATSD
ncbi:MULTISPECIES: DUF986 family protein [unclassified Tatumella]|uniref:DUF986 family protein n=1 Tax=unclassified Tatumella TaxID=2649542 RepID=UPI001BB052E5|nr:MULTISPECIES: DUF986 family protein [unclassified Tatumella]MBS0855941.1 DUF986 domain-containing protein [Tatumella sp. JGM16]MBS0912763.1 DUF986 domain-containing protein [Tatumella sp. JGM91]